MPNWHNWVLMETSGDSSRRTTGSILSISTSSSRASQGCDSDVELVSVVAQFLQLEAYTTTVPEKMHLSLLEIESAVKENSKGDTSKWWLLVLQFVFLISNLRRFNRRRRSLSVWRDFVCLWNYLYFHCVHFGRLGRLRFIGSSHLRPTEQFRSR